MLVVSISVIKGGHLCEKVGYERWSHMDVWLYLVLFVI